MGWIQDRAGFNVNTVFQDMIERIQRDIDEVNELIRSQSSSTLVPVFFISEGNDPLTREVMRGVEGGPSERKGFMSRPPNRNDIAINVSGEEFRIRPYWDRKRAQRRLLVRRSSEESGEDSIDYNDLEVLVQEILEPLFFPES